MQVPTTYVYIGALYVRGTLYGKRDVGKIGYFIKEKK